MKKIYIDFVEDIKFPIAGVFDDSKLETISVKNLLMNIDGFKINDNFLIVYPTPDNVKNGKVKEWSFSINNILNYFVTED